MSVRVIGGRLGRRRLEVPTGAHVRPTPDRVRESVFAALGDVWEGRRVLDLFAGSGSLGVECVSRGAAHATFVERDGRVAAVVRRNLASLGLEDATRVLVCDARRALRRLAAEGQPFDAVWLDPPYGQEGELAEALSTLAEGSLLAPGALVIAEHPTRRPPEPPGSALEQTDRRRYGDTTVTVYRRR